MSAAEADAAYLVGVDVGGTFTDITVLDRAAGTTRAFKALSNRAAPDEGVRGALARAGIDPASIARIVHGTTVATNALLERRGARTALIVTEGFRDVLELGRTTRLVPNSLYDPYFVRPAPLVPRRDRHVVAERVDAGGQVSLPLDEAAVPALAAALLADGVESIAIGLLNSYCNPVHEHRLASLLREHFEHVSASVDVLNEIREYERISTCVVNAAIMPVMARYIGRLLRALREAGFAGPFMTMASHGGVLPERTVQARPASTILSGPAAGIAAASRLMDAIGMPDFITYDMGGTSTDVALVAGGRWPLKREAVLDGIVVKLPQLDINTIGAGGGSIARLDAGGALLLGPESAGATPGPACYGRGGIAPTVTDANVVLGRLGASQSLGASLAIDADAARMAVAGLAARRGAAPTAMADGIIRLAVAKMAAAIHEVSVARGFDPRDFVLLPYGGAGPLHACLVADELGIPRVVVPPAPGAFSSYGALCATLLRDRSATLLAPLSAAACAAAAALRDTLAAAIRTEFIEAGVDTDGFDAECQFDLRYAGQAHELIVPVSPESGADAIREIFEAAFEQEFGRRDQGRGVELVNVRVLGRIPVPAPPLVPPAPASGAPPHRRAVWFDAAFQDCPVLDRAGLARDADIEGPCIVTEMSATLVVPPGWRMQMGRWGELLLTREPAL